MITSSFWSSSSLSFVLWFPPFLSIFDRLVGITRLMIDGLGGKFVQGDGRGVWKNQRLALFRVLRLSVLLFVARSSLSCLFRARVVVRFFRPLLVFVDAFFRLVVQLRTLIG